MTDVEGEIKEREVVVHELTFSCRCKRIITFRIAQVGPEDIEVLEATSTPPIEAQA